MKLSSCSTVYTIEDNIDLEAKLSNKSMPTKEIILVPIGGGYGKYLIWNTFKDSQKLATLSIFLKTGDIVVLLQDFDKPSGVRTRSNLKLFAHLVEYVV